MTVTVQADDTGTRSTPIDLGKKYAPQSLDEVIMIPGDRTRFASAVAAKSNIALIGPPGMGKTATSLLIAREWGLTPHLVDGSKESSVKVLEEANLLGQNSIAWDEPRLIIIDEADGFSKSVLKFLKGDTMLDGVPYVLTLNEPEVMPSGVLSRCEVFQFDPDDADSNNEIVKSQAARGRRIAALEGFEIPQEAIDRLFSPHGTDFRVKLRSLRYALDDMRAGRPSLLTERPGPTAPALTEADVPELTRDLVKELASIFSRHLVLPQGADIVLALYVLHAYSFQAADWSAILAIVSPQRNCGKTQLVNLLLWLIERAVKTFNTTGPGLFTHASQGKILLLDEADRYLREGSDLVTVLNAGVEHANVLRFDKEYDVFGPKIVARIGQMVPDTTESRCISIQMMRAKPEEVRERVRPALKNAFAGIRSRCGHWSEAAAPSLLNADPAMPSLFYGRVADKWRALFAIADLAGTSTGNAARKAAERLESTRLEETDPGTLLLEDIRSVLTALGKTRIRSEDLANALMAMAERPWHRWRSPQLQMSKLLSPYGIRPKTVWFGSNSSAKGYYSKDFDVAFARYLPPNG